MAAIDRVRHRLHLLWTDQRGMALPTALFAMIASFGLATAAILSSVNVQQGTHYDGNRKNAIAAADAGASVALLRLNRFQDKLEKTPCVGPAGESMTPTGGWCPATPAESLTNGGATFTYQVSAFNPASAALSVVAVGKAGNVARRVKVGLLSYDKQNVFADEGLIGEEKIEVIGNPYIKTDVGTNGDVFGKGNAFELCGNVRHGIGGQAPDPDCEGEILEGEKDLPAIVPPVNIATVNSNCRLVPNCLDTTAVDPYVKQESNGNGGGKGNGKEEEPPSLTSPYVPGPPSALEIGKNATLTMGGGDYLFCKLVINGGGELIMAGKTQVRIFIDSPEHCGYTSGALQVDIHAGAEIKSTANAEGEDAVPGIYVLGSPTIETKVLLAGTPSGNDDGTHELLLYAPYSEITIAGNSTWKGSIAGKSLIIHGNPTIETLPGVEDENLTIDSLWERTRYVECTGPSGSPPDASC